MKGFNHISAKFVNNSKNGLHANKNIKEILLWKLIGILVQKLLR